MISIIIPYRDREVHLAGCLRTIEQQVPEPHEVIIAEQLDTGPFLRGQLCNLALAEARGDLLVLLDVDGRFVRPMEFGAWMGERGRAMIPFSRILQVTESADGEIGVIGPDRNEEVRGLCNVLTREQFESSGGFSNLMIGWGPEDRVMERRLGGFARVEGDIAHVMHESALFHVLKDHSLAFKMKLYQGDGERDVARDSFRQTTAAERTETIVSEQPQVRRISWRGIGVTDGFAYADLLAQARSSTGY